MAIPTGLLRLLPSPQCLLKRCSLIPGLRGVMLYLTSSTLPIWRDMFKWITVGTETHACIEIENYATLSSWSTWLAA